MQICAYIDPSIIIFFIIHFNSIINLKCTRYNKFEVKKNIVFAL